MDADAGHGCHERIMLLCVYEHAVQSVTIEDAVVDTFRGGALFIDLFISICATGDIGVKPDVPIGPGLDDSSIFGIRAAVPAFGAVFFPIRAAPHEVTAGPVIAIGLHAIDGNPWMHCWVNRGAKGIALIDEQNSGKIKYVFDIFVFP